MVLSLFLIGALLADPQAATPPASTAADSRAEAYQAFLEARRLEAAQDVPRAVAALERAAQLDPTAGYALAELAQLYARQEQADAARAAAERALGIEPAQPDAHWVLGMLDMAEAGGQAETGEPDRAVLLRAIEHFRLALPARAFDPSVHVTLGRLYLQTGQPKEAVDALSVAYDRDSGALEAGLLLAQALDQTGERDRAIDILSAVLDSEPRFFRARLVLADLLERAQRWDDAAEAYRLAAGENPRALELRVRQAAALLNAEKSAEARDILTQTLEAAPGDLQARYLLAQAQRQLGDLEAAEETGLTLVELAPADARGPVVLSQVYAEQRQHGKVIEVLTPLVQKRMDSAGSPATLGLTLRLAGAHLALGQFDEVVTLLDRARGHGSDVVIDTFLLQALVASRRFEQALTVGEQVRAARPSDPMPERLVAQALQGLGRVDEAVALLAEQRKTRPRDPMALVALANVLSSAERHDEAIATMARGEEPFGDDVVYWFQRGAVHERADQPDLAEQAFRRALTLSPQHAPTLNYLGYMYAERGEQLDEAVRLIQQALAVDPDNGSYLDSLGWAYFKKGRLEDAREHLQRAADLLPTNSVIQDHLGEVLLASHDRPGAIAAWERALEGDGESVNLDEIREKLDRARGQQ